MHVSVKQKYAEHSIIALTVIYFAIGASSFFEVFPSTYFVMNQAELFVLSLISLLFISLDKNNVKSRSIIISLAIYNGYILATDWAFDYVSPMQWMAEIFGFCALTLFQILKSYNYKTDDYNYENVMIAFYRPKKLSECLTSMFGAPVSSMSIICNGHWYTYRRKSPYLCKAKMYDRNLSDYIMIDTSVKITQNITNELDSLVGTNARSWKTLYLRGRCVSTFKGFLNNLGGKWRLTYFDTIPAIYMLRRLRNEGRG